MEKLFAIILLTLISVVEIIFMLSSTMIPAAAVLIALILLLVCLMIFRLGSRHFWKMILLILFINLLLVCYLFMKFGLAWQLVLTFLLILAGIVLSSIYSARSYSRHKMHRVSAAIPPPPWPENRKESHASRLIEKYVRDLDDKKLDDRVKDENPSEPAVKRPAAKVKKSYSPGKYLASKQGKQYHRPRCNWANNIRKENRVWFATSAEAEKKGYTKHSCLK